MKTINLGKTGLKIPAVALGCMRITELDRSEVSGYLYHALELGIHFFDHADIYGGGECERIFAEGFSKLDIPRESIILQSKCGIVPGIMYDLSYFFIRESSFNSFLAFKHGIIHLILINGYDHYKRNILNSGLSRIQKKEKTATYPVKSPFFYKGSRIL